MKAAAYKITSLGLILGIAVGGSAGADTKKKKAAKAPKAEKVETVENPEAPATTKPVWTTPELLERFVNDDRRANLRVPMKAIAGGKDALVFAEQKKPAKGSGDSIRGVSASGEVVPVRTTGYWFDVGKGGTASMDRGHVEQGGPYMETFDYPPLGNAGPLTDDGVNEALDASTVQAGCHGIIGRGFDFAVWVNPGTPGLRVFTSADEVTADQDFTLVIATPSGEIRCNDDAVGKDPKIDIKKPEPGMYSVWIGAARPNVVKAVTHVTGNLRQKLRPASKMTDCTPEFVGAMGYNDDGVYGNWGFYRDVCK